MDIVLSKSTWPIIGWVCQILADQWNLFLSGKNWNSEYRYCDYSVYDYHLSRSDAASDQAAEDVEDDERNAAGSAEN